MPAPGAHHRRGRALRAALLAGLIASAPTPQKAAADTSLWQISKAGNTLYLGGTIHVLRPDDFPLPTAFQQAFESADAVGLETDIGSLHEASFQQSMLQQLRYPAGDDLGRHLNDAAHSALAAHCEQRGIAFEQLLGFKPAFAMSALLNAEMRRLGITADGVDLHFHRRATSAHKPLLALETPAEQLAHIASLGVGEESEFILQVVAEIGQLEAALDAMIAAWRTGDTAALNSLVIEPMASAYPQAYQQLLVERNRAWLPRIEAWLATPPTELVLVGAAHLAGSDGLLASLRQRGYAVRQL